MRQITKNESIVEDQQEETFEMAYTLSRTLSDSLNKKYPQQVHVIEHLAPR